MNLYEILLRPLTIAELDENFQIVDTVVTSQSTIAAAALQAAADRTQTGLDRTATGLNKASTDAAVISTATDRVQTGLDRAAADESAASAAASALTAGNAVASLVAYTHNQSTASKVWTVTHNKNTSLTPAPFVYQTINSGNISSGTGLCGDGRYCGQALQQRLVPSAIEDIEIVSVNQLKITLPASIAGKAAIQFI